MGLIFGLMKNNTQKKYHRTPFDRTLIVEFLGSRCVWCDTPVTLEIDHKTPVAHGGKNGSENLQLLCEPCHKIKTAHDVSKIARMKRQTRCTHLLRENTYHRAKKAGATHWCIKCDAHINEGGEITFISIERPVYGKEEN